MTLYDHLPSEGIAFRDLLAGQALAGILASYSHPAFEPPVPGALTREEASLAARDAYTYADAMLEEREEDAKHLAESQGGVT